MQPIFITADADEAAEIKKLSRSDRQQLAKHIRKEAIAMRRAVKLIALLPIAHLGGKLSNQRDKKEERKTKRKAEALAKIVVGTLATSGAMTAAAE